MSFCTSLKNTKLHSNSSQLKSSSKNDLWSKPRTTGILKPELNSHDEPVIEEHKVEEQSLKKKKKKQLPSVAINTSRSRSDLRVLKALIEKNKTCGWKEVTGNNGDVMWSGLDISWEDVEVARSIKLNRIPGMKTLAHKKDTGFYLNKFREYYPGEYDFYPRTSLIPEELDKFKQYKEENPDRLFIAKPTIGGQGEGIILIKKFGDLSSYANNQMIVQEYIDKPLLHNGKKFDLRLYLLISNVKPMLGFLNEEGLARFCTENYDMPTKENMKNNYMHLTNYSLNKLNPNFNHTEECTEINEGSKRTLTSLWKGLEIDGVSKDEIMNNIKRILQRLLITLQPIIQFNYNCAFEGKDDGYCFHVLGVDVLIDQDLKPWLLEINATPSLNIAIEDLMDTKAKEIISPVDKFVKEKVVEDALLIVKKPIEKQAEMNKYRSYDLIYNSESGQHSGMKLFQDILDIFGKLSGVRFNKHLTQSKFRKLGSIAGMTITGFGITHYDILYQKLVKGSEDGQMNFPIFIEAIEEITAMLKKGDYDPENKRNFMEEVIQTIKMGLN